MNNKVIPYIIAHSNPVFLFFLKKYNVSLQLNHKIIRVDFRYLYRKCNCYLVIYAKISGLFRHAGRTVYAGVVLVTSKIGIQCIPYNTGAK
jgi:hypothetical protein